MDITKVSHSPINHIIYIVYFPKFFLGNAKIFYNITCINLDVNLAVKQQKVKNLSEELTRLEVVLVKKSNY